MSDIDKIILNGNEYDLDSGGGGITPTQKQTLMDVVNIIGAFSVPDAQDYIDAFNEAWNVTVTGIRLNKSSIAFNGFGSEQLRAILIPSDATGTVTWTTSNNSIATVTSNGLVTPVGNGSCTITASCSGFSASCSVTATNIPQPYAVTSTLSHCVSNNPQTVVFEGSSYSATITADVGYELSSVTCTMGGVEQVVTGGVISIAEVTGDIAIIGSAVAETTYTSGNGLPYTKRFSVSDAEGTMAAFFTRYGLMEHLEELTFDGRLYAGNMNDGAINSGALNIGTYCPSLKKLVIDPSYYGKDTATSPVITAAHYAFTGIPASLTYLQFGSVNPSLYWNGGRYFRNDGISAGLTSDNAIGNTNGIEIVLYTDTYRANGGFLGNTVSPTTVFKEYSYLDGSELTA